MMTWTLQRYVFREMGRAFFLTALGLITILSMGGGVFNMIHIEELTARQLVKLMALVIPVAASLTLPIAAMFSAAATYGRLASDNEFVACRSSGINIQALLLPALVISLGTGLVTFLCINSVSPRMVRNLDQIVGRDLHSIVRQRLRRPGGVIPGLKRYRMYWDEAPDDGATLEDGLILRGVAFLEMDEDAVVRVGTAGLVQIRLEQNEGRTTISGVMRDITYYEPRTGEFFSAASQTIDANEVPFTLPAKLKFLNLRELFSLRSRPQRWHEVREEFSKLRVAVGRARVYQTLLEQSRDMGVLTLNGPGYSYRIESPSPPFLLRDGSLSLQDVRIIESRAGRSRNIRAGRATVEISRAEALSECAVIIHLYDDVVVPDFAEPAQTVAKADLLLTPIQLPQSVIAEVEALTDGQILSDRVLTLDDPLVTRQHAEVISRLGTTVRKITGIIHQRLAFTISVFVLVTLAAVLGIVLRDAQMLTAFGISFVPSLFVIVAIVMGKQLAGNDQTVMAGLLVMWSGLGLVALLDVWMLMGVLRR